VAALVTIQGNSLGGSVVFENLGPDGTTWEAAAARRMSDGLAEQSHAFSGTFAGSWEVDTQGSLQTRVRCVTGLTNVASVWIVPLVDHVSPGLPAVGMPTTTQDGGNATMGAQADAANTDHTTSGTMMAFLKGLLSKLKSLLPASLGQKAMTASLAVVIASDQTAVNTGTVPAVSFAGGSTGGTTTGGTVLDNAVAKATHSMVVTASATLTGTVSLQGSHDNSNWVTLASVVNAAGPGTSVANAAGMAYRYVRAFTPAAVTGGSFQATVASA
jgi:hypothetical protein